MQDVAIVLIEQKGRFLLLRRSRQVLSMSGRWNPPGGLVEAGETIPVAGSRETLEEGGLLVEPGHLQPVVVIVHPTHRIHVLYAPQFWGEVSINWESDRFRWVPQSGLRGYPLTPGIAQAIKVLTTTGAAR